MGVELVATDVKQGRELVRQDIVYAGLSRIGRIWRPENIQLSASHGGSARGRQKERSTEKRVAARVRSSSD